MGQRRRLLFVILVPLLVACGGNLVTGTAALPLPTNELSTARPLATARPTTAPSPTITPTTQATAVRNPTILPTPTPTYIEHHAGTPITPAMLDRIWRVIHQTQAAKRYRMTSRVDQSTAPDAATVLSDDTVEASANRLHYLNRSSDMIKSGMPQGLDVTLVDGIINVHGPLPLSAAQTAQWYQVGQLPRAGIVLQFTAGPALQRLTSNVPLADLQSAGMISLDGLTCDQFAGGRSTVLAALNNTGHLVQPGKERPIADQVAGVTFDQTDYHLTLCSDDAIHQIEVTMRSHIADTTSNMHMLLHLWDINGPGTVTVPANTQPLQLPAALLGLPITFTALVANGGNMRQLPVNGAVLDQANAGETLDVVGRTVDAGWLLVGNPRGVTGWMSTTLLTVDPDVMPLIPTTQ